MAQEIKRRMLVMENGSVHEGTGFGSMNDAVCELVSVSYTHLTLPTT